MAQPSTDPEAGTTQTDPVIFAPEFGGKMVLFAGYEKPVQYLNTRSISIRVLRRRFDVSRGQVELLGEGRGALRLYCREIFAPCGNHTLHPATNDGGGIS